MPKKQITYIPLHVSISYTLTSLFPSDGNVIALAKPNIYIYIYIYIYIQTKINIEKVIVIIYLSK